MVAHPFPEVPQSLQLNAKRVGVSDHDPVDAVSVPPCTADPEIVGSTRFRGRPEPAATASPTPWNTNKTSRTRPDTNMADRRGDKLALALR